MDEINRQEDIRRSREFIDELFFMGGGRLAGFDCSVKEYREKVKKERGCYFCGYKKCLRALHFHHIKPGEKTKNLNQCKTSEIEDEIKKCIVVCANCHAEIHSGVLKYEE